MSPRTSFGKSCSRMAPHAHECPGHEASSVGRWGRYCFTEAREFRRVAGSQSEKTCTGSARTAPMLLFLGGKEPPCLQACDTNGDASLGLTDAVFLLRHLFFLGSPIPAPYPGCGAGGSGGALGCEAHEPCRGLQG